MILHLNLEPGVLHSAAGPDLAARNIFYFLPLWLRSVAEICGSKLVNNNSTNLSLGVVPQSSKTKPVAFLPILKNFGL